MANSLRLIFSLPLVFAMCDAKKKQQVRGTFRIGLLGMSLFLICIPPSVQAGASVTQVTLLDSRFRLTLFGPAFFLGQSWTRVGRGIS